MTLGGDGSGRILLDTHILVWMLVAPEKLTLKMRKAIVVGRQAGPLAISAISLWEIAWLVKHGRIETTLAVNAFVKRCAAYVEVLPMRAFPATLLAS